MWTDRFIMGGGGRWWTTGAHNGWPLTVSPSHKCILGLWMINFQTERGHTSFLGKRVPYFSLIIIYLHLFLHLSLIHVLYVLYFLHFPAHPVMFFLSQTFHSTVLLLPTWTTTTWPSTHSSSVEEGRTQHDESTTILQYHNYRKVITNSAQPLQKDII